ncbi:hypothetical protein LFREDSHE_38950 [Shewanella baltica]
MEKAKRNNREQNSEILDRYFVIAPPTESGFKYRQTVQLTLTLLKSIILIKLDIKKC